MLELGCGVGLVGIVLSRVQPARILCTDGNEDTIINCRRNFNLNGQKIGDQYSSNDWISVQKYAWEQDLSDLLPATRSGPTPVDIVVGSDLLYDPESFPSLVRLLMQLLTVGGAHTAYLACTRRNDETLKSFEQLLEAEEGIIVVKTTFPAFELDNSVRFCHVPSLEAARQCIVFYKINFLRN